MGLLGILAALGLLIWLSFRGWSILLLAPAVALVAAATAREPLLAHWTQTFMGSAAQFIAQFFPIFLLGALFGKLMDDSGSVQTIASFMGEKLGHQRAVLAVVLAGALVTYGGVSLFVAFFVLAPMARALFQAANIPRRLMPAAIALGTSTFTMSAMPGTPAIQNTIPMPFFGTTPFAAPGLGIIAAAIMLAFGMWWLTRAEASARKSGEGYGGDAEIGTGAPADDQFVRERATSSHEFDPAEIAHGKRSNVPPPIATASIPLLVVVGVNLLMSLLILPRLDFSFLEQERWGGTSLAGVAGVWSVAIATIGLVALTGAASGGLTIALDALGDTYLQIARTTGIDPALMHRIAVIGSGTLDSLPHNGAVVTLLAVCGSTHRKSYFDMVIANIVGPIIALAVVIVLGSMLGSF